MQKELKLFTIFLFNGIFICDFCLFFLLLCVLFIYFCGFRLSYTHPHTHTHAPIGKQFSLDSRMDLVFHGLDGGRESGNENHAITEDGEESWEGTKGRYCAMIIYRKI